MTYSFYETTSLLILDLSKNKAKLIKKHIDETIKKYKGFNLVSFSFADEQSVIFVWGIK